MEDENEEPKEEEPPQEEEPPREEPKEGGREAGEKNEELEFYVKFTRPLVLNLPDPNDRVLAAAWVKKILTPDVASDKLRTDYIKLLLFALQRNKLVGIFSDDPNNYDKLEEFPEEFDLNEMAKIIIEKEQNERQKRIRDQLNGQVGDFPPYTTDWSADLKEFAAAQDIPGFGVHCYYAISKCPINQWMKLEKAVFPKYAKSAVDTSSPMPRGDRTSEPCVCPPKDEPEGEPSECRTRLQKPAAPKKKKPKKLGQKPPLNPLGKPPEPEDRDPPIWGSNLVDVHETEHAENVEARKSTGAIPKVKSKTKPVRIIYDEDSTIEEIEEALKEFKKGEIRGIHRRRRSPPRDQSPEMSSSQQQTPLPDGAQYQSIAGSLLTREEYEAWKQEQFETSKRQEEVQEDEDLLDYFKKQLSESTKRQNLAEVAAKAQLIPARAGLPVTTPTLSPSPKRIKSSEQLYEEEEAARKGIDKKSLNHPQKDTDILKLYKDMAAELCEIEQEEQMRQMMEEQRLLEEEMRKEAEEEEKRRREEDERRRAEEEGAQASTERGKTVAHVQRGSPAANIILSEYLSTSKKAEEENDDSNLFTVQEVGADYLDAVTQANVYGVQEMDDSDLPCDIGCGGPCGLTNTAMPQPVSPSQPMPDKVTRTSQKKSFKTQSPPKTFQTQPTLPPTKQLSKREDAYLDYLFADDEDTRNLIKRAATMVADVDQGSPDGDDWAPTSPGLPRVDRPSRLPTAGGSRPAAAQPPQQMPCPAKTQRQTTGIPQAGIPQPQTPRARTGIPRPAQTRQQPPAAAPSQGQPCACPSGQQPPSGGAFTDYGYPRAQMQQQMPAVQSAKEVPPCPVKKKSSTRSAQGSASSQGSPYSTPPSKGRPQLPAGGSKQRMQSPYAQPYGLPEPMQPPTGDPDQWFFDRSPEACYCPSPPPLSPPTSQASPGYQRSSASQQNDTSCLCPPDSGHGQRMLNMVQQAEGIAENRRMGGQSAKPSCYCPQMTPIEETPGFDQYGQVDDPYGYPWDGPQQQGGQLMSSDYPCDICGFDDSYTPFMSDEEAPFNYAYDGPMLDDFQGDLYDSPPCTECSQELYPGEEAINLMDESPPVVYCTNQDMSPPVQPVPCPIKSQGSKNAAKIEGPEITVKKSSSKKCVVTLSPPNNQ